MPYLVKIGFQKNNITKSTCKGYHLFRRGTKVIIRYGAIDVSKSRIKKFRWKGNKLPIKKIYRFRSTQKAKEFKDQLILQKLSRGYSELSGGLKIYKINSSS